jgi:hypothetical protein
MEGLPVRSQVVDEVDGGTFRIDADADDGRGERFVPIFDGEAGAAAALPADGAGVP